MHLNKIKRDGKEEANENNDDRIMGRMAVKIMMMIKMIMMVMIEKMSLILVKTRKHRRRIQYERKGKEIEQKKVQTNRCICLHNFVLYK